MRLHWTPDLSVKNNKIDKEHQRWIELFNNFYSGITDGKPKEQLEQLILGLLDYTKYHFSSEEQFMQSLNYPYIAEHKANHDFFVNTTEELYKNLSKKKSGLSLETIKPLKKWLVNHIMGADLQYAHFAEEKNKNNY